jgi:predicted Zn-dependent peptidase
MKREVNDKIILLFIFFLFTLSLIGCGSNERPENLKYRATKFIPPPLPPHRYTLDNGVTAFVVEDKKLPVFDILAVVRTGGLLEPQDRDGLAQITSELLESGGTQGIPSDSLDERIDFHAATLSSECDRVSATLSLSILSEKTDTGLYLFTEVLTRPAFEQKKLDLAKARLKEAVRHRFDHPKSTLQVAYDYAMYGKGRLSELISEKEVDAITRADVENFHRLCYRPENLILAVSGRFETKEMLKKLNATVGRWKRTGRPADAIPDPPMHFQQGLHFVEKDINQAYIRMGLPALKRPHPDYFSLAVMNYIFGGAPFVSRISKKIREEEGLAYSAGSSLSCGFFYRGHFNITLETKSASAAYAVDLALKEMKTFLDKGATEAELADAKKSLIDAFPANFKTGEDVASAFAYNQYYGRGDDYFDVYCDNVGAITLEDVRRVAGKYLKPNSMAVCVVGRWKECAEGDGTHPVKFVDFGVFKRYTEREIEKDCLTP